MVSIKNFSQKINTRLDFLLDRMGFSIKAKLVIIFLIVKIVPLIVLLLIVWSQVDNLSRDIQSRTTHLTDETTSIITSAGDLAVTDSTNALISNAVDQIERITTDTAGQVADFLYERDSDIRYLASIDPTEANYDNFIANMNGLVTEQGVWDLSADGMSWERKDAPSVPAAGNVSTNDENNDVMNGASFNYRPADTLTYKSIPLYDEITFIGTDLVEKLKVVSPDSPKTNYPMDTKLEDISVKANTYIGAEDYGEKLKALKPGEIYVSDVIGAYVPTNFIGMYTPKQMIVSAVSAEITALTAMDPQTEEITTLTANLTSVKTDGIKAIDVSGSALDPKNCDPLMSQTADAANKLIDEAAAGVTTQELKDGITALKNKISGLKFDPYNEAFAGEENPIGKHFEGIIRWATPVVRDGQIIGYVSFALNHDHIMQFTDHITPMSERYTELPSAFDGNYAFIWDYQCRSIAHPRNHSIVGYDPATGKEQIPWIETSIYQGLLKQVGGSSLTDLQKAWPDIISTSPAPDYPGVTAMIPGVNVFDNQSRTKKPAADLTAAGLVGLDGRYLNNAPQCTGWMDLTAQGGSGSFYILWSGLYKLTTAAAIPYYTGQYAPSAANDFSKRGFGMVTIGAGLEDFQKPAEDTAGKLALVIDQANQSILQSTDVTQQDITNNTRATTIQLIVVTAIIIVLVTLIAIWVASFIADNINILVSGLTRFRLGDRHFRFKSQRNDEFGELANSFDDMAAGIENSVTTPISITDKDLNIIYMNDMALAAVNNTLETVKGKSYKKYSIYPFGTEYCPITALQEDHEAEIYFNAHNNKYYKGKATWLLDKGGERIGYVITSMDMTDASLNRIRLEQAVEEANRANEHKGEFLARMSHEIRTPMNAIIGVANIVDRKLVECTDLSPEICEVREYVSQIENSSQHLLGLLNDILDLSKIEAGKIKIVNEPVNITKLGTAVFDIIRPRCESKHIDFSTDIDASLEHALFMTDPLRLRQVLLNLLGNAVKFTPELGRICLEIKKTSETDTTAHLRFVISDNGIGIEESAMKHIFEAFEQGDGSITRQYGGTGLGLPISNSIVQILGGEIGVDSKPGEGSVFSFELDMETAGDEGDDQAEELDEMDFSGKRILIVDDVNINRMIVSTLLEYTGVESLEAEDGKQALEIFENSPEGSIDVILMDVMMPVMDGLEATVAIRALDRSDSKTVTIIALTANAFKDDVEKTFTAGMNAHLTKPIDPASLISMLCKYINGIE